jgi:hypothetical protein
MRIYKNRQIRKFPCRQEFLLHSAVQSPNREQPLMPKQLLKIIVSQVMQICGERIKPLIFNGCSQRIYVNYCLQLNPIKAFQLNQG